MDYIIFTKTVHLSLTSDTLYQFPIRKCKSYGILSITVFKVFLKSFEVVFGPIVTVSKLGRIYVMLCFSDRLYVFICIQRYVFVSAAYWKSSLNPHRPDCDTWKLLSNFE